MCLLHPVESVENHGKMHNLSVTSFDNVGLFFSLMFFVYRVRKRGTLVIQCGIDAKDAKHVLCPRQPLKIKGLKCQ